LRSTAKAERGVERRQGNAEEQPPLQPREQPRADNQRQRRPSNPPETELDRSAATQISIETAQPRLDLSVLAELPSKTIVLGVLDLGDPAPETADVVARRLEAGLKHVPTSRLVAAPDCGMKYLPRDLARAKLTALVDGAALAGR
jgi:methionine synthase II (cobalamin-independent)